MHSSCFSVTKKIYSKSYSYIDFGNGVLLTSDLSIFLNCSLQLQQDA